KNPQYDRDACSDLRWGPVDVKEYESLPLRRGIYPLLGWFGSRKPDNKTLVIPFPTNNHDHLINYQPMLCNGDTYICTRCGVKPPNNKECRHAPIWLISSYEYFHVYVRLNSYYNDDLKKKRSPM